MRSTASLALVAGGVVSALLALWALRGMPFGNGTLLIAPMPLLAVGLGFGPASAVMAALVALMSVLLLGGVAATVSVSLTIGVPAAVASLVALPRPGGVPRTGMALAVLSVLGIMIFLGVGFSVAHLPGGLQGMMGRMFADALRQGGADPASLPPGLLDQLVRVIPSVFGVWFVVLMAVNAAVARRVVRRADILAYPAFRFRDVQLPPWFFVVPALTITVSIVADGQVRFLAIGATEIAAIAFILLGLAVVHTLVRLTRLPRLWLVVTYAALMLLPPMLVVLVVVGVMEPFVNLRARAAPRRPPV